jgi:hypothetical protein
VADLCDNLLNLCIVKLIDGEVDVLCTACVRVLWDDSSPV